MAHVAHATLLGLRIIAMYGAYRAERKMLPYPHGMPDASESRVHLLDRLDWNLLAVGKCAGLEYFPLDPLPC